MSDAPPRRDPDTSQPGARQRLSASTAAAALALAGGLVVIGVAFWVLAALAAATVPRQVLYIDRAITAGLGEVRTTWLDIAFMEITLLGSRLAGAAVLLPASAVLWIHHLRAGVVFVWVAYIGGTILSSGTKLLVGRARPDPVEWVVPYAETASFPSGHAIAAVTVYLGLAYAISRIAPRTLVRTLAWLIGLCAVLLVGVSRVYLGVHYPSDVLAGYLLALLWLAACALLLPAPERRQVARLDSARGAGSE